MSERKPLTLEELRQMVMDDNDCMAFVVVHDVKGNYDVAAVLDEVFGDGICAVYSAGPVEYMEKDYGKTWLAYAYEPPILDRSAWEPCAYCGDYYGKCCANCWNGGKQAYQEPCKSCYCASKWKPKENFCPCCGRPMHDAAWEMLQKRLEGHK